MPGRLLLGGAEYEKAKSYWFNELKGNIDLLELPVESTEEPENKTENIIVGIDDRLTDKLLKLSKNQDLSLFTVLVAAFKALLYKYTFQEKILIGLPVYCEDSEIYEYNHCLALVNTLNSEMTFKQLLLNISKNIEECYNNQFFPMDKIFKILNMENQDYYLHRAIICMDTIHDIARIQGAASPANDMMIVINKEGKLNIQLSYNAKLFKKTTMDYFLRYYVRLINAVTSDINIKLCDVNLATEEETGQTAERCNYVASPYAQRTIIEQFEEIVQMEPKHKAIQIGELCYTYEEINERANLLAIKLINHGVGKGAIVGVVTERSWEIIVGMLAVLKASGTYLPISPQFPFNRIKDLINDSGAKVILTKGALINQLDVDGIVIDISDEKLYEGTPQSINYQGEPEDIAYIIYTSGSTGKPKGVKVSHRGVLNLKVLFENDFNINKFDKIGQFASISFDASVWEIYMALLTGATLHIFTDKEIYDYREFENYINKHQVTVLTLPPNYIENLNPDRINTLRLLIAAGSKSTYQLVQKWTDKFRYVNAYGPSEVTVCATTWEFDMKYCESRIIPIGKPIPNTRVYILDNNKKPLPPMIKGEIYISGAGLAKGYLHNETLTRDRFLPDLYADQDYMYRTGDVGRWLPDGNIEFIGRNDNQVKMRGYRIELEEIENQLINYYNIKEAIVLIKEVNESNMLCALVTTPNDTFQEDEVKRYLANNLPEYMIPQIIIRVEELPQNSSGKIDRKSSMEVLNNYSFDNIFDDFENDTEEKITNICKEILEINKMGPNSDFFKLGGQSLKAIMLVTRIKKEFRIDLPITQIFTLKTPRSIANYMNELQEINYADIEKVSEKGHYEISSAQRRIYIVNQLEKDNIAYNMPGIIRIKGKLIKEKLELAFTHLIQRHEAFRTYFATVEEEPYQFIADEVKFTMEYVDGSNANLDQEEIEHLQEEFIRPFDLSNPLLLRVKLIRISAVEHIMFIDLHHIISDGLSIEIMIKELAQFYNGDTLPELKIQYKDFSEWQNKLLNSNYFNKQEEYWLNYLKGYKFLVEIPSDYSRANNRSFAGETVKFELDFELTEKIHHLMEETQSTLFMVMLSAYCILLHKYTGHEDIVIGSSISGRSHADLEGIIGMFVNMLPLRNFPEPEKCFIDFLYEVKKHALESFENQDYQYEHLVRKISTNKESTQDFLINNVFAVQKSTTDLFNLSDLVFETVNYESKIAKFDTSMIVFDDNQEISFGIEYRTSLFKKETIVQMGEDYINIVKEIVYNPNIQLKNIFEANIKRDNKSLKDMFKLTF
ncbi:amino acid adenylation domain-containing protein [Paenibacillus sp. M1]|uniref:Amino acid adenylation domain-containing protein n=1 Tax=Paenibacillus haidiansis TaxID=1574488 RepID=A0ABU7VPY3_9BACL